MKALVIEDEDRAADHLISMIQKYDDSIEILDVLDSVKKSAKWLNQNPSPDLIFLDIQLGDGVSFEIFDIVEVVSPIIFITAYDEYALQAFKVNSIDYLLKPVHYDEFKKAMDKFNTFKPEKSTEITRKEISRLIKAFQADYKNRFVVKIGEHIKAIPVDEILFFFSKDKTSFAHTRENRNFIIDYSLDQIEEMLDPQDFFRVNRKYLIRIDTIKDITSYFNNRLKVDIHDQSYEDIIVSRERVSEFKNWLDR